MPPFQLICSILTVAGFATQIWFIAASAEIGHQMRFLEFRGTEWSALALKQDDTIPMQFLGAAMWLAGLLGLVVYGLCRIKE